MRRRILEVVLIARGSWRQVPKARAVRVDGEDAGRRVQHGRLVAPEDDLGIRS